MLWMYESNINRRAKGNLAKATQTREFENKRRGKELEVERSAHNKTKEKLVGSTKLRAEFSASDASNKKQTRKPTNGCIREKKEKATIAAQLEEDRRLTELVETTEGASSTLEATLQELTDLFLKERGESTEQERDLDVTKLTCTTLEQQLIGKVSGYSGVVQAERESELGSQVGGSGGPTSSDSVRALRVVEPAAPGPWCAELRASTPDERDGSSSREIGTAQDIGWNLQSKLIREREDNERQLVEIREESKNVNMHLKSENAGLAKVFWIEILRLLLLSYVTIA
ncbi:hypothetical protein BJ742DRAFT_777790 [Cladochytrium replicatum]|nr:hypothetical protein BJ742DRAFT_777790 [Cladochytrium replicatum]